MATRPSLVQRHWNEWLARGNVQPSNANHSKLDDDVIEGIHAWQTRPILTNMSSLRKAANGIVRAMARRDRTGSSGWSHTRISADVIARTIISHQLEGQCRPPTLDGVEPSGLLLMGRLCGQGQAGDRIARPGVLLLKDSTGCVPVCAEGDGLCVVLVSLAY